MGRFIIDSLMNLPLLFWAGEATGDGSFREKANRHLAQVKRYLFRPDGSTIQVCRLDIKTGELVEQGTHQGLNAHSCWSRGQAWGIYGMALAYRYTGDAQCLAYSKQAADYFLAHLPEDGMCAWDFALTEPDTPKDTSAAAIAACGLLELARQLPLADDMRQRYERAAVDLLLVLAGRHTTANVPESNGILLHGRYTDDSVDECMIWGDYFYMEALVRALRPWRMYW